MTATTWRRLGAIGATSWSVIVTVLLLRMPTSETQGGWIDAFRGYFSFDQLSYAAISATAASGDLGTVEPYTQTGSSFYPSAWYRLLGMVSSATGWSVPATWTILGMAVVIATILFGALVSYRVSGRWWAPALVGPALWIGPIAAVLFDGWYLQLQSHAVLWGPYGAFYTLNAEVIGLCLAAWALGLVLLVATGSCSGPRRTPILLSAAAALIGVTANLQTYSFLTAVAIAAAWAAAAGLRRASSRAPLIATIAIVVLVAALGSLISSRVGALPVFALMLLAALPGGIVLLRPYWRWAWLPLVILAACALPQIALTASGVLSDDAFLAYRQEQSGSLGVVFAAFILGSAPILAWWLWVRLTLPGRTAITPLLDGLGAALVLLSFNDLWGFSQEPYRLWIDTVAVAALLLPAPTAMAIRRTGTKLRRGVQPGRVLIAAALAALLLVPLSWWNLGGFRTFVSSSGVIDFGAPKVAALGALAERPDLPAGLLTADPCTDPQMLKVASGLPVAFYNLGLAWPQRKEQIDAVLAATKEGRLDDRAMREAGIAMILTDSACQSGWDVGSLRGATVLAEVPYEGGSYTLWRLG